MPPYEPPRERFTPPREIVHTPPRATHSPERITKSSRRKSTVPKSSKKLVLQIKKEPPEVDLSEPPPPPSPSDDPLLLKGQPGQPRRHKQPPAPVATSVTTHSRDTPSIASSSMSPSDDVRTTRLPDLNSSMDVSMQSADDDSMDESFAGAPPIFDFTNLPEDDGVWSDDDDDEDDDFDQSGEYTGRFKVLTVPTKADPPSSCTRSRQDAWGNPSSPHPGGSRRSLPASSSPPLKAGPESESGSGLEESPDEEDVFFLDTPAAADTTVREEFEEGSSRQHQTTEDKGMEEGDSVDIHDVLHEWAFERSPSPLPIVDIPSVGPHHQPTDHQVRFAAATTETYEDVSMELEGSSFGDLEPDAHSPQEQNVHTADASVDVSEVHHPAEGALTAGVNHILNVTIVEGFDVTKNFQLDHLL